MNLLPIEFISFILPFATLLSKRTWHSGLVLLVGAILAPGKHIGERGVASDGAVVRSATGERYHRVLNRAVWSSRQASRILLNQLIAVFAPTGVLVMGVELN